MVARKGPRLYQLLATARGWGTWRTFLPDDLCANKLFLQVQILLAHMRPVHPIWERAMKIIFGLSHPSGKLRHLMASYPWLHQLRQEVMIRKVHIKGFSAGSFTGLALHKVLCDLGRFEGTSRLAAIAAPTSLLQFGHELQRVVLIQCTGGYGIHRRRTFALDWTECTLVLPPS